MDGDVPPHCRQGSLHHRVGHDPSCSRVRAAAEALAEASQLGFDLLSELSCLAAQLGRPAAIDEVIAAVVQQDAGFLGMEAHPLRHVQRRAEPGFTRGRATQTLEECRLEGSGRPQPHLRQHDIP